MAEDPSVRGIEPGAAGGSFALAVEGLTLDHLVQSVVNATDVMLVCLDHTFKVRWVNPAFAGACRKTPAELIGRSLFDICPNEENERIFRRVVATGEPVFVTDKPFQFPGPPERGATFWDWSLVPIKAEDGSLRALAFSLRETTEYKRMEAALRASGHRFRRLVEVGAQMVWLTNAAGEPEEDSPSWREFTGRSLEQYLGRSWLDAVHPDDRARVAAVWKAATVAGTGCEVEFRMLDAVGEYRLIMARAVPILGSDGAIVEWIGMNTDITERRRAEDALREARDRAEYLARFPEQNPDPVLRISFDLHLLYANPASRSAIPALLLPNGAVAPTLRDGVRRARAAGRRVRREVGSGGRTWLMSFVPCEGYVNVYAQEITKIKRAEQALRLANAKLRDADRRKDEFLAVLSHELRNPLAPIRNAVHLLESLPPGHEKAVKARAIIARQVTQLAHLVDDLLDVNRIATGKVNLAKVPLDLVGLLAQTAEDYRLLFAGRRIELETRLPPAPVRVDGDAKRLAQAVGNVLQNAAKFTPSGGTAWLTLDVEGEQAVIRLRDTGVGIDPALLGRVFEPFTQADRTLHRSSGGLGLGLSLVAGIMRLHGGVAEADSRGPGTGTEITLRLPCHRDAVPERAAHKRPRPVAARPRSVLVIEDNPDAAESLRELLTLYGHQVESAHSGDAGLERFARSRPDAVICDIGLPGMDGYEVARRIRQAGGEPRVLLIALTGYGLEENQRHARDAGFDAHLTKPVDLEQLQRLLSGVSSSL